MREEQFSKRRHVTDSSKIVCPQANEDGPSTMAISVACEENGQRLHDPSETAQSDLPSDFPNPSVIASLLSSADEANRLNGVIACR